MNTQNLTAGLQAQTSGMKQVEPHQQAEREASKFADSLHEKRQQAQKALGVVEKQRAISDANFDTQERAIRKVLEMTDAALALDDRPQAVEEGVGEDDWDPEGEG